jgi:hypothetical protein
MDETANPRGCKLEIGKKDHSGISRLFLETHSRMPSLQESSGIIFSTDECQKIFAGTEGSLCASLANLLYSILPGFLTFFSLCFLFLYSLDPTLCFLLFFRSIFISFECKRFYSGNRFSETEIQQ